MGDESTTKCVLCTKVLTPGTTRTFKRQAIVKLIGISETIGDGKADVLRDLQTIDVHNSCYSHYTRPSAIESALKKKNKNQVSQLDNNEQATFLVEPFDFDKYCFLCGDEASDEYIAKSAKAPQKYEKVHIIQTNDTVYNIIDSLENRTDDSDHLDLLKSRLNKSINYVEKRARYHRPCFTSFDLNCTKGVGRPRDENVSGAVNFVIDFLRDHREECQFSLKEILQKYKGSENIDVRYIKTKLSEYFGNDLVICPIPHDYTICFLDVRNKIISNDWYKRRKQDEQEERKRIVETAANIILEDIRRVIYKLDEYPAPNSFLNDITSTIPVNLKHFLDIIIKTNKKESNDSKWDHTSITLAHSIIAAARPRSFISPVLLGLSSMIHKKYTAKNLIDSLSHLGLCASYNETLRFEASIVVDPQKYDLNATYLQFVFDNADFNASILDNRNSFRSMGGIMCVTPAVAAVQSQSSVVRLKKMPTASSIGTFADIPLKYFTRSKTSSLSDISIQNLKLHSNKITLKSADFLWFFGKSHRSDTIAGWNGFSESCTSDDDCILTKIIPLPFVNNPPSNYNTILTMLVESGRRCIANEQRHTFVTFDQPLYLKAREILACSAGTTYERELSHVVVRLGGFHSLMSFLSAIGFVMEGSGLLDVFCILFAPNSATKALTGHAFSKAVRGNILVQCALAIHLISRMEFNASEKEALTSCLDGIGMDTLSFNTEFFNAKTKFENLLEALKSNGPTSSLWVQYFAMVQIFKDFIEAEKTGNWKSHLYCLQQMLPYFHASGQTLYAKSVQLYLQDMLRLQEDMDPFEYEAFTDRSYFTIKRKVKRRAGNFTDQIIEQSLMRSMKTLGGLTRGRGITDSVVAKWILSSLAILDVSDAVEDFCGSNYSSSEQHVDQSEGRISRDAVDLEKLLIFFESHNPFPITDKIMSISTGVIGDSKINCHQAFAIGNEIMDGFIGENFSNVTFSRKKKVLSLKTVNSSIVLNDETIVVDSTTLFTRACLLMKSREDLKEFLKFELSPYPQSLFTDVGMRKTNKASFYSNFDLVSDHIPLLNIKYVVDGEFLLHKVIWQANDTIDQILSLYASYVQNHFTLESFIVFDGYPETTTDISCLKTAERQKSKFASPEIDFGTTSIITVNQEAFLSNDKNKIKLIKLLCTKLQSNGFRTAIAEHDADNLIINTAINIRNESETIAVVGEDIDLLVLLCQLVSVNIENIYFIKPGKGKTPECAYASNSFKCSELRHLIAFIHVFCGCDSTSAFYNVGKTKLITILKNDTNLQSLAVKFYSNDIDLQELAIAGKTIIGKLYGGKMKFSSLNELRFMLFEKCSNKAKFKLELLPPTEDAAEQHCYRAYVQLQKWLGNKMNATDWGWMESDQGLKPITTVGPIIPEQLLQQFACGCEARCKSKSCTCRKNGIGCSYLCTGCQGQSCSNSEKVHTAVEPNTIESLDMDEASNDCLIQYLPVENPEENTYDIYDYGSEYDEEVDENDDADDEDEDVKDDNDDDYGGYYYDRDEFNCDSASVFSDEPLAKKSKLS